MSQFGWLLLAFGLAVIFDFYIIRAWRRYRQVKQDHQNAGISISRWKLWKQVIFSQKIRIIFTSAWKRLCVNQRLNQSILAAIELALIAVWSIFVGKTLLDFDPQMIPAGREFNSAIQTHHLWTQFQKCGWCAVWNGAVKGGFPAFADIHGSMLHPIVMITSLLWGVLKGAKIALVVSFWFAGFAQWWIARELRLGWLPRLWSAGMAVVGGHLAGRLELGVFGVVLSTAMCSLVFGGILSVARGGGKRSAVLLGVVTASALLSGQGYIQVGLLGIFPAMGFLLFDDEWKLLPVWKDYTLAFVIAIILAAPLLVPFLHFSPNFVKNTDPSFKAAQSIAYLPLNLVIDEVNFYYSEILGKLPFPHLYTLFIGWIPVVLALFGFMKAKAQDRRIIWFLVSSIVIEFMIASAIILKWLTPLIPQIAGVRHSPQIAGLAVPLILGLSAYGLDCLLNISWPNKRLSKTASRKDRFLQISFHGIVVAMLFISMHRGYNFSQSWMSMKHLSEKTFEILDSLSTESLAWVGPPFGEQIFIEPAIDMGYKISPGILTYRWKDRNSPLPALEAVRNGAPVGPVELVNTIGDVKIYKRPDQYYAAVYSDKDVQPCFAFGSGGEIDVYCDTIYPGKLIVKENTWSGWMGWMDSMRVDLIGQEWIEVDAPDGNHTYQFRYQPWDVVVGLFLFLIGAILSVYVWCSTSKRESIKP
jgi:hypothetical protein